jgi:hypothetical protein
MSEFVNLSRPTLETTDLKHPQKVRLPSGYTLLAFPKLDGDAPFTDDAGGDLLRVSVYPPGSDCQDADDRVAEFWIEREDADVILLMCRTTPPVMLR